MVVIFYDTMVSPSEPSKETPVKQFSERMFHRTLLATIEAVVRLVEHEQRA